MSEPESRPSQPANNPRETRAAQADAANPANSEAELRPEKPRLTPEEQMALYEKDLKENDWGHQPC